MERLLKGRKQAQNSRALLIIVAVVVVGVGMLVKALAAGTPIAFEAESGVVAAGATVSSLTGASGTGVVKFGSPAATPSPTPSGAKPGATNTGVPAGQSLTVVSGNQTFGSASNGQTISNKDFRGYVKVTGSNITFVNCIFHGGTPSGNGALLDTQTGTATGIVVRDSEFVPANPAATIDGVDAENLTLLRVNIHGSVDGVKASSNTVIQDSYIHDMQWFASDPNQGGGSTHNDGVQILSGTNIRLTHNTIAPGASANAAVQITQDFGTVGTVSIASSWVDYGGCTLNIAQKPQATLNGVSVTSNRFGRHQGFSGCTILIGLGVRLAANTGNVWDDTGQPVPPPQQHN